MTGRGRRSNAERDRRIALLYAAGYSQGRIAKDVGMSSRGVANAMERLGITADPNRTRLKPRAALYAEERERGDTVAEIAARHGVTTNAVYAAIQGLQKKGQPILESEHSIEVPTSAQSYKATFARRMTKIAGDSVTMGDIKERIGGSRTTILAHIRKGVLRAQKRIIDGKPTWLIEPEEADRYCQWRAGRRRVTRQAPSPPAVR